MDIGEAASREIKAMRESKRISEGSYLAFFKRAKLFYSEAISKLLKTFPMDNQLFHDLQVLHPLARQSESAKQAIKCVAVGIKMFSRDKLTQYLMSGWSTRMRTYRKTGTPIIHRSALPKIRMRTTPTPMREMSMEELMCTGTESAI